MENNVGTKNRTCFFFDDKIKIEDFGNYNILLDGKSFETILIYDVLNKTLIGAK